MKYTFAQTFSNQYMIENSEENLPKVSTRRNAKKVHVRNIY